MIKRWGLRWWMNSKSGVTRGGIGGPLRFWFDVGIGRETVVQMGGGKPGAKDRATGKRLEEREEDVDSPTGEDDRAIFGWALKQGTSVCETREFGVSNHEVREVKDRTSGCERRDFSHSCRVYAGLKGNKVMSLYILIYLLRCRIEP